MAERTAGRRLSEIAKAVGGELRGEDRVAMRPVPADSEDPQGITFATNEEFLKTALSSGVMAVLVPKECPDVSKPVVAVENPREAFGIVLSLFTRAAELAKGIHETVIIEPGAVVDKKASVGPYTVIAEGAIVEGGARIFPNCFVGPRCRVGRGTTLHPNVVLLQDVEIQNDCLVHSGAVLGSDGFGFVWDGEKRVKVPHAGQVIINDSVEIGANTTIDRASCGETVVGEGVKLDNQVQLAHGVVVGPHSVIAAQSGVSGSTQVGARAMVGGQVGFGDHLKIADDTAFGGASVVLKSIEEPGPYAGNPVAPLKQSLRQQAGIARLPELLKRVKKLEQELSALKDQNGESE